VLFIYILLILLLGCFLDSISILLLTVPITFPVFLQLGVDPVWFGIVTIIAVEVGIITPPLGIGVFVVKATLDDPRISLSDVFAGALPFVAAMLLCLGLIVAFPSIVTGFV
jgi:TRAP-type C4-dicarboxylate transport system permease large subunit